MDPTPPPALAKAPTGIAGFDEITFGGLPKGRPTLVCGNAGCGKTLLGVQFLVAGATRYGEPGVFLSFEESVADLATNVSSLNIDLAELERRNLLVLDEIHLDRSEIEEAGDYDLEGLFIRLDQAVGSIGAKRVVIDTLEALFSGFSNEAILRSEISRLFRWLKERDLTAVVTGERTDSHLTRHGLEEFVSDCVILLDHRITEQISTRRLRVIKYRGSLHGCNEYPFLIDEEGISILPITSVGLSYPVSQEILSSGIPDLDAMLGERGFFKGSSILVSGPAGTGKTTLAGSFAAAACQQGKRCIFVCLEEAPEQVFRDLASVGIDLSPCRAQGRLNVYAARPTTYSLEVHLSRLHRLAEDFKPDIIVIDPVSSLLHASGTLAVEETLTRLMDYLKLRGTTAMFTSLAAEDAAGRTALRISSLVDTWIQLGTLEGEGRHLPTLSFVKSRGMAHSNEIRWLDFTRHGILLRELAQPQRSEPA